MALPRAHAAANPGLLRSSQGGLSQPPATAAIWEGGHESHLRLSPLLRRGRRITEDTRSSEESEESEEEGEGSDKPDPVAWSMPDGFTLGAEPSKLDASLVGKHIYMRWKDYGWQLGKVYEQITSANPRLLKIQLPRGLGRHRQGPDYRPAFVSSIRVENYAHGSDAALDSWVVLERKEGGAGGAE